MKTHLDQPKPLEEEPWPEFSIGDVFFYSIPTQNSSEEELTIMYILMIMITLYHIKLYMLCLLTFIEYYCYYLVLVVCLIQ